MNLPPFVFSKAFWTAVSWLVAGIFGLLIYFGILPEQFGWPAGTILTAILAILKFFDVNPEVQNKGFTNWKQR